MKILIVGGGGFLGSHLYPTLRNEHDVKILSRHPKGENHIIGDITNPDKIENLEDFDIIINLAGLSPIFKPKRGTSYKKLHVEGTRNLIDIAKKRGIDKFIYLSAIGADADSEFEYLSTKYEAEQLLRNSGLEYLIIRPSLILGQNNELSRTLKRSSFHGYAIFPDIQQLVQPIEVDQLCKEIKKYIHGWNYHKNSIKYGVGSKVERFGQSVVREGSRSDIKVLLIPIPRKIFNAFIRLGGIIGILPKNAHLALTQDNIHDEKKQ